MCPWRSFSSPPSPSSSLSSTLSIPPSFLPNLFHYLLNSTLNLTPSFAIAKLQKLQNIVSERAITSVSLMVLSEFGSAQVAALDFCFRIDSFSSISVIASRLCF
ncbi:hypothetical protein VNO80_22236 [Phaseolus coccineus]|uniref:Uncharacterized protein n=1 Tax=Phaseolus coccineus TaxID=3886 RepID=A0AAN9M4I3_PHACN